MVLSLLCLKNEKCLEMRNAEKGLNVNVVEWEHEVLTEFQCLIRREDLLRYAPMVSHPVEFLKDQKCRW